MNWYASGSGAFNLQYRPQGGQWTTISSLTSAYGSYSYSLTGLSGNTVYEWGVADYCSPTVSSSFTPGESFTTTCANNYSQGWLTTNNITPTSAELRYYNYSSNAAYDVRYRPVNTPNWITSISLTSSALSLTGLTPNTVYEWQVAVRCSATASSTFTESLTFVTECRAPTNLYSYNITFNAATVSWNGSTGTTYEVDYRSQGAPNWTTVATTSTLYNLTGLATGVNEWRVRSNCGTGIYSAYSPTQSFTTVCFTPTNLRIEANSYAARASWYGTGAGGRYTLQWRQGAGSWNTISNITQTEYTVTGLNNGGTYQIQIQSNCGAQTSTPFSTPVSFTANCPTPSNLGLATQYSSDPIGSRRLNWTSVAGVNYLVQWRLQGGAWNSSPVLNELSYGYYQLDNLALGTYDWQVGAVCADGVTTTYKSGQSFSVSAGVSCNPTPPGSPYSFPGFTMAILGWDGTNPIGGHEVRWRPQGATVWNLATNLSSAFALRGLQGNTAYEWQVRALCSSTPTTFGPLQSFRTDCRDVAANLNCVDATRASVSAYSPISTQPFDSYRFYQLLTAVGVSINELGSPSELNWRVAGTVNWNTVSSITAGASYTLTGLTNNTVYEYRARSVCSPTVSGSFTNPVSFTTACVRPTGLYASLYDPSNGNVCTAAYVAWSGGCSSLLGGGTYTLRSRVVGATVWQPMSLTNSLSYSYLFNLTAGATYEYQVQTECGGGTQSGFSDSYTFVAACRTPTTTVCSPVPFYSPRQFEITNNAATLSYYGTSPYELRWRQAGATSWNTMTTTTSPFPLTGLTNSTAYDWQVRSACSDPGDFTPISYFRTMCNIPPIPTSNNIRAESAQVSWGSFNNGTTYEIRYRTGTGAWTTVTTVANAFSYTLTSLTNNTAYEWQIRTLCGGGNSSDWSHSLFFTTICPAPSTIFTDRIDRTSVRTNWLRSVLNGNYVLQYRQQGSGTWTTVGSITSNSASLTYAITGLTEQTTYEWQVLTDCGNGNTSATPNQPLTFRTLGTAPPCSGMVTVQNGDWTNPAVWSCNRVPLVTDPVQVLHTVTIPDNNTGRAQRLSYGAGGKVTFGTAARLLLNQ